MRAFIASVGLCLISLVATTSLGHAQCSPDTDAPVIANVPANITATADAGACGTNITWTVPTASDNCELLTFAGNQVPGDFYAVGVTTVTYTAMDVSGNMTAASFYIIITDDENPTFDGIPADISSTNDAGICGAVVTWDAVSGQDNCGVASVTSNHNSGSTFPVGTTTVTYTLTDVNGNTVTDSFDVTVTDTENPSISGMPADITQSADAGVCTALVSWTAPTASDNCLIDTFSPDAASGSSFGIGTTTVTYTATDIHGNSATATFNVTVTDTEAPTITNMPANITQTADAAACGAVVNWTEPTIADNCALAANGGDYAPGDTFPVGTTTVTYTATDASGNSATAQTFTITVTDDEVPTFSGTPADISQGTDAGLCNAVVTWTAPTSSDNCAVDTLYSSHSSGDTFAVGNTTVTYTTVDIHGNTATTSFTVTVSDDENPSISGMPADITQSADAGSCSTTVTWTEPTDSDNCGSTLTSTHSPGDSFPVGNTTVTYTSTDAASNSTTASFTVTVTDNENPTISGLPTDIIQSTDANSCNAVVTWTAPTANDNCPGATITSNIAPGATFALGTTLVTYTATDGSSNTTTGSFLVTILDNEEPVIAGTPANITQTADAGSCTAAVTWIEATASDNCTVSSFSSDIASGATFGLGATTVTYTATDNSGNTATSSFTVTITDNEAPTITGTPADISLSSDAATCSATATWTAPTAADNCGAPTLTSSHNPGDTFPVGTTTVTYTATDASANTVSSSFNVVVTDNTAPTISGMPADIAQSTDAASCTATVNWTAPTSSDNCLIDTFTSSHNSGDAFSLGTTTVTYTATDIHGNTTSSTFDVTVTDDEAPTISGTADITAYTGSGGGVLTPTGTCTVGTDESLPPSSGTLALEMLYDAATGDVTIRPYDSDTNAPWDGVASGLEGLQLGYPNKIINDGSNTYAGLNDWDFNQITEDCFAGFLYSFFGGSTTVSYNSPIYLPGLVQPGIAEADLNNFYPSWTPPCTPGGTPGTFTYVIGGANYEGRVVVCGASSAGGCSADVTWTAPTATDNCTLSSLTGTHNSGSTFELGTTAVTYSAIDAAGNVSTASFNVTVLDTISPTISGMPADISQSVDTDSCNAVVTWTPPTADDNCALISLVGSHTPGDTFNNGSTTVTYTATDTSGNATTSSFTVTVTLTESPTISGVPADMSVSADAGICGAAVTWTEPTATGSCGTASLASNYNPGDTFPVGTTTVTYTADQTGAPGSTASFDITVTDNEAPVISGMPADINVSTDSGVCTAVVSWTAPTASDNCNIDTFTSDAASGSTFGIGSTVVTYTATDVYGNSTSSNFTVTVTDNESPSISGIPANITASADAGLCTTAVTWVAPTASDNCTLSTFTSDIASGTTFFLGTTTVTYTATDAAGNVTTDSFTVTVIDNQNPTISGTPADITVSADAGVCSATASWTEPTAADNCPGVSLTSSHASGSTFPVGTTTVTYTGTDTSGNTSTATFNVTVTDSENPTISGMPSDITVSTDAGLCTTAVTWTEPTASDNCAVNTFTADIASGTTFFLGTTTVTYTATDIYGNSSTATFDVIVQDNQNPTISGLPADITQQADAGLCTTAVTWTAPTAADNCPGASISSDIAPGTTFFLGTTTVTYTATDAYGNQTIATFNVIVVDNQNPTFTGVPSDITVSADAGSCSAAATWTAPTSADNCPGVSQSSTHAPGASFPVGTTTVTYTGTDTSGNTATASFNVTVTDNTAPTIAGMPADITLDPPPAQCDTAVTWTEPTASDNCGLATFTSSLASGNPLSVGTTTTVTYTATDVNGNTTTASFTITVNDPDFDGDSIGDCTDPDIDNDGSLNADDSDDFNNSVCSDTDGDGCEDCAQGGANSYDPSNDGSDSDGDGICDGGDNCSDPLANNYLDPANEECQVCPNAPLFNGISCTNPASTLSSADGAISLDIAGNPASTLYLWGINGAPDTVISLPANLDDLQAGYYTAMVQDADGCWGVADTSVGGTTLQQPAIMREVIIPFTVCCSGCGVNDVDADGLCDDGDNCTDQSACNFDDACNEPCVYPDGNGNCTGYGECSFACPGGYLTQATDNHLLFGDTEGNLIGYDINTGTVTSAGANNYNSTGASNLSLMYFDETQCNLYMGDMNGFAIMDITTGLVGQDIGDDEAAGIWFDTNNGLGFEDLEAGETVNGIHYALSHDGDGYNVGEGNPLFSFEFELGAPYSPDLTGFATPCGDCNPAASVTFLKPNYSSERDTIVPNVILARGNSQGLYNAATQASWDWSLGGPEGTFWKLGPTNSPGIYTNWRDAMGANPDNSVGNTYSLWIPEGNLFFDIDMTFWQCCGSGGGFGYTRTLATAPTWQTTLPGQISATLLRMLPKDAPNGSDWDWEALSMDISGGYAYGLCDEDEANGGSNDQELWRIDLNEPNPYVQPTACAGCNPDTVATFTKPDYSTSTVDQITPNVALARGNNAGYYNAMTQSGYSGGNVDGTYWKWGPTSQEGPYGTWASAHGWQADNQVGNVMSLWIPEGNLFFDIETTSWTCCGNGGGFSYTRTLVSPPTYAVEVPSMNGIEHIGTVSADVNAMIYSGGALYVGFENGNIGRLNLSGTTFTEEILATGVLPFDITAVLAGLKP